MFHSQNSWNVFTFHYIIIYCYSCFFLWVCSTDSWPTFQIAEISVSLPLTCVTREIGRKFYLMETSDNILWRGNHLKVWIRKLQGHVCLLGWHPKGAPASSKICTRLHLTFKLPSKLQCQLSAKATTQIKSQGNPNFPSSTWIVLLSYIPVFSAWMRKILYILSTYPLDCKSQLHAMNSAC